MIKTKKYVRSAKTFLKSTKRQAKRLAKPLYVKDKRMWGGVAAVVLAAVFWLLPAFAAAAPGQLGYTIKRGEESLVSTVAPLSSWRTELRLDFANNRVTEAAYVANQVNENGDKNQTKAAATINGLLDTYENTYEARTATLNQDLENGVRVSKPNATEAQKDAVTTYATLESLLLQAPNDSQLSVLTAIDDTQSNIATLNDALGNPPLSASDFSQLAKLVSSGILSQSDVAQLSSANSSRQLHKQVVSLIESGEAPSDLSYVFDLDLVKQYAPTKAQVFETVAQFEQLQRISAVISASRPSADQQKAIQTFLASYTAGQTVPANDIHQYVMPIVDGVLLSGQLQVNLPSLNAMHMGTDDQALYDSWKAVLDPPNLSDTYQKLMTDAGNQPALHLRILTATQQEMVDAQKAQVAYLVMPPGWDVSQFGALNNQMSTAIAETSYQQSNPNTAQELASLATTQQQLQTELNALTTTYNDNSTKLQTQINNFNGTPDQLAQLKADLATLIQNQTTTVSNLQTQLTDITDAHTQLGVSIENLRQEQTTNLAELELRAATNAQQLTAAAKSQLGTSLNQIGTHSQALITGLQTKIDDLTSSQSQTRTQLTADITTIKDNYQQLAMSVQSQLDAGVATNSQLQANLSQAQSDITSQQTKLTDLTSGTAALSQLVNQVKTDSASQIQDLQGQVTTVKLDQQTTKTAVSDLQHITQTSQGLITTLQSKVNTLGSSQDLLRGQLTTEISSIKSNYQNLSANVQSQIDAGVATTSQLTTDLQTIQATLAQQASQLASLGTNSATLAQLIDSVNTDSLAQVSGLQGQINVVKISQQTTDAAVGDLQTITQNSQNLITGLQSRIDTLGSNQTQLRQDLTAAVQTVQDNYAQLAAYTQAQIDAGVATSTQLQTNLQTVQATLGQQTTQLASLSTSNAALSQLVDQVKIDSTTQVSNLQNQLNGLAISQRTISTALDSLKTQQASDVTQLTSQLAGLSVLQTEAQATITVLTQTQSQAQTSIDRLTANFGVLQTAFDASQQVQTAAQTTIANQQSEIDSLQTQTQSALDTLTQQQTQLTSQLSGLASTTTALSQIVSAVQSAGTTTQTQLTTLLANPPWALATAAYVTQDQLNSLSTQLNTQFAQKSAQLDQQFQTYQAQLNASVSQLNSQVQSLSTATTSTTTAQTQQQAQIATLNSQIQALQTQIQQLVSASTPHTGL